VSNIDPKTSASEAALSTALRELAHSAPQSAPPELGDSLIRAFHRHHRRRRVLRATSLYLAILAISGGGLLWVRTQSTRTPIAKQSVTTTNTNSKLSGAQKQAKSTEPRADGTAVSQPTQQGLGTGLTPIFAKTEGASSVRRNSSLHRQRTASSTTTAQNNPAIQGLFVSLPSFAFCAPDEELRVIRVNMPISSLRLLGAPVDEGSMTRSVTTDLLIGSDGTPYAVRLVM
jgi:hypothetical protein